METPNSKHWWKTAKIYELYVDKFAGNFKGLTKRLDYFNYLGINCLHILPHYPSPMFDDGYDVTNYYAVREELGTLEDMREMIREAHKRGIRVIIDLVLNHMSREHPWFVEARSSKDNPRRDFFLWSDNGTEFKNARNAFSHAKKSNWVWNEDTKDFYFSTFFPEQPDLNWDNPEVIKEISAVIEFWCGKGIDGFRLDAAPFLVKRETELKDGLPETHKVLKKLRARMEESYPEAIFLAEAHSTLNRTKEYFGQGDECHLAYNFPLTEELWYALLSDNFERIKGIVEESKDIPDNCEWAMFLRNHDEISFSAIPKDLRTTAFTLLDPNHLYSHKGTQKTSQRLATALKGNIDKIKLAFEYLYSFPGVPVMYYGEEIGMPNLPLREGTKDPRRYVRGEFDWNEVARQMEDPHSLLNFVSRLIKAK